MAERTADLYPLSTALAEALRTAPYGLFEAGVDAELSVFDDLGALAVAIHERRRGLGRTSLEVADNRALVWGEAEDETRPSVDVVIAVKGSDAAPLTLTAVLHGERAAQLYQALAAHRPQAGAKAAA